LETNRRLPAGNFYDPFHRRIVEYDMSGRAGTRGAGQGDGAAGSSRPSRQGTVAPPRVHRSPRQRSEIPRGGRLPLQRTDSPQSRRIPGQGTGPRPTVGGLRSSRQGTGAPGASNS
jgi:hypothetical protein